MGNDKWRLMMAIGGDHGCIANGDKGDDGDVVVCIDVAMLWRFFSA